MSGSNFDLIAREILKLKQLMEQMQHENRELRQQLSDLRAGRGIFVAIEGKHFALAMPTPSPLSATSSSLPTSQEAMLSSNTLSASSSAVSLPISTSTTPTESSRAAFVEEEQYEPVLQETAETETPNVVETDATTEATEVSETDVTEALTMSLSTSPTPRRTVKLTAAELAPTFLEEAMIDEFTNATTSPLAVWSGPPAPYPYTSHTPKQTEINEDENEVLRRQLIGSFLLE